MTFSSGMINVSSSYWTTGSVFSGVISTSSSSYWTNGWKTPEQENAELKEKKKLLEERIAKLKEILGT